MARKKPETPIEVCTFFDGELDIAQVFTNLIAEKIHQQKTKKPLVNTDLTVASPQFCYLAFSLGGLFILLSKHKNGLFSRTRPFRA